MTPFIDYPADWAIGEAVAPVLQAMFPDYVKIVLQKEFTEGQSGTQVFLALPYRTLNDQELPVVVKIGAAELIDQEWSAAARYANRRLPGFLTIIDKPTYWRTATDGVVYGGLRYEFAGQGIFRMESLRSYSQQAPVVEIWQVMEKYLFPQLRKLWETNLQRQARHVHASYDRVLPVNLLIDAWSGTDTTLVAGARLLHADEVQENLSAFRAIPAGTLVRLNAFQVTEIERQQHAVTLNLPQSGETRQASFRLRVQGISDLAPYQIGERAPSMVGRVQMTRQDLLTNAMQGSFDPPLSWQTPTLSVPGMPSVELPNPLYHWPTLLQAVLPMKIGTVHGDLNMGNILVDSQTHTTQLIDCAHARREHVLYDLIRLETETLLHALAAALLRTKQPPTLIYDLYGWLDEVSRAEAHPAGQFALPQRLQNTLSELTPSFVLLSMIRNAVRGYLATPNDWREYYSGLALSLLGALKFASLTRAPTGQQPKAIAFWGAATLLHLLSKPTVHQTTTWILLDLTKPAADATVSNQPTTTINQDNRSGGIYFEGNQSVKIKGDIITGGTVNKATFHGPVTGPVHTGSGNIQGSATANQDKGTLESHFADLQRTVADRVTGEAQHKALRHVENLAEAIQELNLEAMASEHRWFQRHLPALVGKVVVILIHPTLAQQVVAAGEPLSSDYRQRFGALSSE